MLRAARQLRIGLRPTHFRAAPAMKGTVLIILQIAALCQSVVGRSDRISLKLRPSGERAFVDSAGREMFFHGVNAIVKGPPWIPETDVWDGEISLSSKDLDDLESLGLNVIRLGECCSRLRSTSAQVIVSTASLCAGAMWPGLQPDSKDEFSSAYAQKVKRIVDAAAYRGIYTLLDMHQDVISENFCGEGN
jgi:hypothetical protein